MKKLLFACLVCLPLLSACATIFSATKKEPPFVYSGVRKSFETLKHCNATEPTPYYPHGPHPICTILTPIFIIDLPLSLIADTAILPIQIPRAMLYQDKEKN
ncbi:uncharacterized protein YceK [Cricetibacter osteomyelitidis]|uniref:Uncharacterized protein YceK n=1 Tax=Cricetibacter osteomyelitidis TaxID=1521931 RepID=A0A4R2SMB4_9PAST|nr:YceK/YidQ family lipoprotein [Cricetibacter osteomyelitidis]TCP90085.1 uncharacterized protein YceK [Cricetibacter osteomyelitidis]